MGNMMGKLFDDLKEGLDEAVAHAEGKPTQARARTVTIERSTIQATRLKTGLTQKQFASVLGAGIGTLRKWEQGQRAPSGAAARLLQIIAHRPGIVKEALGEEF
jgi:putative transcriptional regulator